MKIYGGDACLWLYPKHRPEAKRDLQLLNTQKMGEQPGEAVTAAMFPAMRDALAEQKQTPLSIDDVTAMIAWQIEQFAPMDKEIVEIFQQFAKKMIDQAGK